MNVRPKEQIYYISTKKMEVLLEEGEDGSLMLSLQSGCGDKLILERLTNKYIAINIIDSTKEDG